jgi:hypothetical protein
VSGKTGEYFLIVRPVRSRLSEDNNIETLELLRMPAKGFPHETFQAVPPGSPAAMLFGYGKPESCAVCSVLSGQDRKQIVAAPVCFGKH